MVNETWKEAADGEGGFNTFVTDAQVLQIYDLRPPSVYVTFTRIRLAVRIALKVPLALMVLLAEAMGEKRSWLCAVTADLKWLSGIRPERWPQAYPSSSLNAAIPQELSGNGFVKIVIVRKPDVSLAVTRPMEDLLIGRLVIVVRSFAQWLGTSSTW